MPRRRREDVVAALVAAAAAALGGCQSDAGNAGCQITQQAELAASPLTLARAARLDQVGTGFMLFAADDTNVRWAALDGTSFALGTEHATPIPSPNAGVWYAAAGGTAPGDTVVTVVGAASGNDETLSATWVPADGSGSPSPAAKPLVTLTGAAAPGATPPLVAMGSSRPGKAAAVAWASGNGALQVMVLGPSPATIPTAFMLDTAPAFACLGFQPGNSAITAAYYKYTDDPTSSPSLVIAEIREDGGVDSTLTLTLPSMDARCPLVTPTDTGYAVAWQDSVGTWLGVYTSSNNRLFVYPVVGALAFGGADLQPPLAGFAPMGGDFADVLQKIGSVELWRLSGMGNRRSGALLFPSQVGNLGTVSSLPVAGSLYATYADYSSTDAGVGVDGRRFFLKTGCF
jgi:hypothetical protein